MRRTFPLDHRMPALHLSFFVQKFWALVLSLACLPIAGPAHAQAPITPSGLNTQVSAPLSLPTGQTQFNITGGTRPGSGTNLFHSFGEFAVPTNNIANFLNETALPTSNILGRVTGGNISNIFGTIQTTGFGNANLFLMNPAGFLFGPNATVNVGGMVAFTSADYLRLVDGVRFNATPNATADALLTPSPVAAFGFLGSNPGAITVQGSQFSVTDGQSISLVGGNITIQSGTLDNGTVQSAKLSAPGGQTNLASVASPGEVSAVDFMPTSGMTMGNISLSQGALLDVSADAAGTVRIRGGQLTMDDVSIKAISMNGPGGGSDAPNSSPKISITAETVALSNGVLITADSNGTAAAGDITLNVDTFTTQAGVNRLPLNPTNNFNFAGNFIASDSRSTDAGAGPAGNITIQGVGGPGTAATSVLLKDSTISSRVFGGTPETAPSSITITADSVLLTNAGLPAGGRAATIVANTLGTAPAGYVAFNVNTLRSNMNADETPIAGAQKVFVISNNDPGITAGPTGTITISGIRPEPTDAAKLVALNNTNISTGVDGGNPRTAPGNITFTADTLSLTNDTQIFTASFGEGGSPAGNIYFNVNTLRANTMPDGTLITGVPRVLIASVSLASGQAGNITISGIQPQTTDAARQLALNNIELTTAVFGSTPQTAPASLTVTADNIHLTHSKYMTDTQGPAPAGNIVATANTLLADDASQISSGSSGAGPGGNISMTASQSVTLNSGSSISASSTGPGNAGHITITAGQSVTLTNGASVSASSTGTGNAGNVSIQGLTGPAQSVTIDGAGSGIFTDTQSTGAGGNITVNANTVTLQNGGTLSAATSGTAQSATGGTITVRANQVQLNSGATVSAETTGAGKAGSIDIAAQQISLTGGAQITASTGTPTSGSGDAGTIQITATESLSLTDASLIASNSNSISADAGNAGLIELKAPSIDLQGSSLLTSSTRGPGNAGAVVLNAGYLSLSDFSSIATSTTGPGRGGDITVQGLTGPGSHADTVTLSSFSRLGAESVDCCGNGPIGDAGSISVSTGKLLLTGNSQIVTSTQAGSGRAGDIVINATDEVRLSESRLASESIAFASGNAGSVTVTAPKVILENQGLISTSTEFTGKAGDITINANSLQLTSGAQITSNSRNSVMELVTEFPEFADFFPVTGPAGAAGTVTVHGLAGAADTVLIDGAGSGIFTETRAEGAGGNISLSANSVTLQNGGTLSAATTGTAPSAIGGTITVDATNTVTMTGGATMTANSSGAADAGSINITAVNGLSMQNSTITTQVTPSAGSSAGGGNIKITTSPEATVLLQNSTISASVADGPGGGGNISIDPQFVILQNSQILAQAAQGQGGAITIVAGLFLPDSTSVVNADSGSGLNGNITIQSPNSPASGKLLPLSQNPLIATTLLSQRCAALAGGSFSSFTLAGRESLPAEPGGWLSSPLALAISNSGSAPLTEAGLSISSSEPTEEMPLLSLRQIAPPGFLSQTFAVDSAGCGS